MKIGCLLIIALSLGLVSCADTGSNTAKQDEVSSIPWNRPERWEGQGMMNGIGTR